MYTHEEIEEKVKRPPDPWVVEFVTKSSSLTEQEKKEYLDPVNYRQMMLAAYEHMCKEHGRKHHSIMPQ